MDISVGLLSTSSAVFCGTPTVHLPLSPSLLQSACIVLLP